jgi:3-hydroxyisobutyrate dehydrogenase
MADMARRLIRWSMIRKMPVLAKAGMGTGFAAKIMLKQKRLACKPLGLPPARMVDILSDTSGTPTVMKLRAADIARLLDGEPTGAPAFAVSVARKDLITMAGFAETLGVCLPVTQAAAACYEEASRAGLTGADLITLPVFWADRGGHS